MSKITNTPKKYVKYNIFSSFRYAINGFFFALKREPNISIQLTTGILTTLISLMNGQFLIASSNFILMSLILSLEMVNSSIEKLCDLVDDKYNKSIKRIKDMSAGAVLVAAISWMGLIVYQIYITIQIWFF